MRKLELKVPPLALLVVFAIGIVALGHLVPVANLPFPGHRVAAVMLLLAGVAVAVAGVLQFRLAKTTVNPMSPSKASAMVVSGVFGFSRNPMYAGMASVLLGVSAWYASLLGCALVVVFCWYMTEFQIKPEERVLLTRFGEKFSAYLAKVRRWL